MPGKALQAERPTLQIYQLNLSTEGGHWGKLRIPCDFHSAASQTHNPIGLMHHQKLLSNFLLRQT
jgi:hypothetical protein